MRSKRGIISFLLVLTVVMGFVASANHIVFGEETANNKEVTGNKQEAKVNVEINGELLEFPDANPFIDENSRTLVPIRFIAEALGAKVRWESVSQTAILETKELAIQLPIGQKDVYVNNKVIQLDTQALIKESRTFVPLRFVAESFGAKVKWDSKTSTALIIEEDEKASAYELSKEDFQKYIDNGNTQDTFDFYGERILIKPNSFKFYSGYHESLFAQTDHVPNIDEKIYIFLKNHRVDKRFFFVDYWERDESSDYENDVFMSYAYNDGFVRSGNYYYAFFLHDNHYYNGKEDWQNDGFSEQSAMRLHLVALNEIDGSSEGRVDDELKAPLVKTLKEMFPVEGEAIVDYVLDKYINVVRNVDPRNLPMETKTFGNIQIDYVQFNGYRFHFTWLKE